MSDSIARRIPPARSEARNSLRVCPECGGPMSYYARRCGNCAPTKKAAIAVTHATCQHCRAPFTYPTNRSDPGQNLFCSIQCRNKGLKNAPSGEAHGQWKGDAAHTQTKRRRAQTAYELGDCERCGKPATDRHHKDGDTGNNVPENIQRLCRRCHMEVDGRLAAFVAAGGGRHVGVQPPKPCVDCGTPSKPLRKGRCNRCNHRFRRDTTP